MKKGCFLLLLLFVFAQVANADIVEPFEVGEPFYSGAAGTGPHTSTGNNFATAPFQTGFVELRNSLALVAGTGDVAFSAQNDGTTALDFDMGVGLQLTTLNTYLIYSEIKISGIEADADASNFKFEFSTQLLDGATSADLSNVTISASSGILSYSSLDVGLFEAELSGASGATEILMTGANGEFLRGIQIRSITPDVDGDEFFVSGSRSLSSTPVPEPGSLLVLGTLASLTLLRRRRRSAST